MKVKSILDTDLYLFSVSYYFMKTYPEASGTLVFNDRNKTVYTKENLDKIIKEGFHFLLHFLFIFGNLHN